MVTFILFSCDKHAQLFNHQLPQDASQFCHLPELRLLTDPSLPGGRLGHGASETMAGFGDVCVGTAPRGCLCSHGAAQMWARQGLAGSGVGLHQDPVMSLRFSKQGRAPPIHPIQSPLRARDPDTAFRWDQTHCGLGGAHGDSTAAVTRRSVVQAGSEGSRSGDSHNPHSLSG